MRIDPFLVERYINAHEHDVELNLAETCVAPFTLSEFLSLVGQPDFFERFKETRLTYGYNAGSPTLREGLANLYDRMGSENVLVAGGAIGANFLVFYSLVEPGDAVISIFPAYQQLYSVPQSLGANLQLLPLRKEDRWLPDLEALAELIDDKTKLLVLNNPHNPTGSLIDTNGLKAICALAEEAGAYVLCDEAYQGLYVRPADFVPSAIDLSERAIVTGSFSKAFSLSGLRLGWITASMDVINACKRRRDYTTISNDLIADALASLAVQHVDRIFERNLRIIRANHRRLTHWVQDEPLIDWVPPRAGSTAFLDYALPIPSEELCLRLIHEKGTFLVPGSCFGMESHLRLGYGCPPPVLEAGLRRFTEFLDANRSLIEG